MPAPTCRQREFNCNYKSQLSHALGLGQLDFLANDIYRVFTRHYLPTHTGYIGSGIIPLTVLITPLFRPSSHSDFKLNVDPIRHRTSPTSISQPFPEEYLPLAFHSSTNTPAPPK